MAELRVHLNFNAMASELEEVKRCMERKEQEKASLAAQVEVTSYLQSPLERWFYSPELLTEILIRSCIILRASFRDEECKVKLTTAWLRCSASVELRFSFRIPEWGLLLVSFIISKWKPFLFLDLKSLLDLHTGRASLKQQVLYFGDERGGWQWKEPSESSSSERFRLPYL